MTLAVYIHWPFCKSKCPYCDFNSHVRDTIEIERWRLAYSKEIQYFADYLSGQPVSSIFFGGGTPSLMPASLVEDILNHLSAVANLTPHCEITLEANPTSVEFQKFRDFRQAGINRVSLGVQSFDPEALAFLGREHSADEAKHAIAVAAETFDRYSFDLIYARPTQTLSAWKRELQQAIALASKHLSLYQLTIEKGTPFYKAYKQSEFMMPDGDISAEFFELTQLFMEDAGMPAYEISNHAAPGEESQHNLAYWQYNDYIGIGPGAHSRLDGKAMMMMHAPESWLTNVEMQGHAIQQQEDLNQQTQIDEMLMMGLRLRSGINLNDFALKIGKSFYDVVASDAIKRCKEYDLLTESSTHILCTDKGWMLLDQVIKVLRTS